MAGYLVIGAVMGVVVVIVLSCLYVDGRESDRERRDDEQQAERRER